MSLIMETIHEGDSTILNICILNTNMPNFIKQIVLDVQSQIKLNKIIVCNFST